MSQDTFIQNSTPQQQWSKWAPEGRFGESQSFLGMYGMGLRNEDLRNPYRMQSTLQREGERAYSFGREKEELERLNMAAQAQNLKSQMRFMPQMDAVRAGILSRMGGGSVGMGAPYSSGTGYTPSWDKPRPSWSASPSQYIAPSWTSRTTPKFPLSA